MYPMQWFWAPQLHFPWSGGVAQQIELDRFFDAIPPEAGDGKIERKAFDVASYGRQLGWISEVLLDLAKVTPPSSIPARKALESLTVADQEIQHIKHAEDACRLAMTAQTITDAVVTLRARDGEQFRLLCDRLLPLLQAPPALETPVLLAAGGL
ncbi:hypothetical protein H3H37_06465 [Duganella sp. LX20W]|uniref:Uncharacterized protein n=1 Tax=Rugamonas brunnea TaxID=2758569 RepID=A0A7W2EQK3_9BURK|nr:hypothetical protein [Rugamonas brunnea]MBA5636695.1 hypothetical protein [Rugamonas brunnea]